MSLQPTQTILNGRYRILRQLGEGGFARVWLAEDTARRLEVAIKEPLPGLTGSQAAELADRFARELRYSGSLFTAEAPNIVRVITVEEWEAAPLLVMEYCGGGSLRDRLLRDGPLPVAEVERQALDLLAALHVVHEKLGWVHRDLKPANVLFTADGRTRLADFGLAQTGDSGRSSGGQPHPGTPAYMSPEQQATLGYLTPASDLYSLGCVLLEALTGKLYQRVRPGTKASSLAAGVPAWLDDALARALNDDPWSRYGSAEEMAAALRAGLAAEAAEQARLVEETRRRADEETQGTRQAEQERQRRETAKWAHKAALIQVQANAARKEGERTLLPWVLGVVATLAVVLAVVLLQNLHLLGPIVANTVWLLGGPVFLLVFAFDRKQWWALIPGLTLLGLAVLVGFGERQGSLGAAIFLGCIGLSFWLIFFVQRENWWAISLGGSLISVAALLALETINSEAAVGIMFLGLTATFLLVYLLPSGKESRRWALIPAGMLAVIGVPLLGGLINTVWNTVWALALIAGGALILWQTLRPHG